MLLVFYVLAVLAQFKKIIAGIPVAILKTIMEPASGRSFNDMCEETEVITHRKKCIPVDFRFSIGIKISEYPPVLSQKSMNIPYKVI
jgi:hypothetical protein